MVTKSVDQPVNHSKRDLHCKIYLGSRTLIHVIGSTSEATGRVMVVNEVNGGNRHDGRNGAKEFWTAVPDVELCRL